MYSLAQTLPGLGASGRRHWGLTALTLSHVKGLVQPAYNSTKNWFTNPPLPNILNWSEAAMTQQYVNNADTYPAAGLPAYKDGALKTAAERQADVFDYSVDWKVGDPDPKVC